MARPNARHHLAEYLHPCLGSAALNYPHRGALLIPTHEYRLQGEGPITTPECERLRAVIMPGLTGRVDLAECRPVLRWQFKNKAQHIDPSRAYITARHGALDRADIRLSETALRCARSEYASSGRPTVWAQSGEGSASRCGRRRSNGNDQTGTIGAGCAAQ